MTVCLSLFQVDGRFLIEGPQRAHLRLAGLLGTGLLVHSYKADI